VTERAFLSSGQFIVSPIPKVGVLTDGEQNNLAGTVQLYAGDVLVLQCVYGLSIFRKNKRANRCLASTCPAASYPTVPILYTIANFETC
jgi:hypothetical protein